MYAIVHGSYRKNLDLILQVADMFRLAGINVICPPRSVPPRTSHDDGFVRFSPFETDSKNTEQALLEQMNAIKNYGFSYFVNPDGSLGASASYELAHAQNIGLPVFLYRTLEDLPIKINQSSIWQPYDLALYLIDKKTLPTR